MNKANGDEILVGELLMKHSDNLPASKSQQMASMTEDPFDGIRGDEQFDIILDKGHRQTGS